MIIDGKKLAAKYLDALKVKVAALPHTPKLAVIIVGENPASLVYVNHKQKACANVGIDSVRFNFDYEISETDLLQKIYALNQDPAISGILVQLPLPVHISTTAILEAIDPHKDVDGFHPINLGRLAQGHPELRPCTPWGVMKLLESISANIQGQHAVVVGTSNIVGKPMALELLLAGATVTLCNRKTRDLKAHCLAADILISAVGKLKLITEDMVKKGSIVIDIGITRSEDGKLHGDVDFDQVQHKAAYITPVPGGVGPMTVAMLLENTYLAALLKSYIPSHSIL